jgi:hypothetical protein
MTQLVAAMERMKIYQFTSHLLFTVWIALISASGYAETAARSDDDGTIGRADADNGKAVEVEFAHAGQRQRVKGRMIIEADDGGLMLQADDGALWIVQPDELLSREELDEPFKPLSHDALAERLLAKLPPVFRVHTTPHYVVCYNTSRAYAHWTSSLLERLHKAFTNYWAKQGLELHEPQFPLPVLLFADRQMYDAASRDDLPGGTGNIVGFYSLRSNRVNMFDLTGVEAVRGAAGARSAGLRRGSMREINQMLSQPAAVPLVSTIVHEATHQIAFNCGLQTRFADIPLWLCEGMAVYFEAPDLASTRGWRGIGHINYPRLERFQRNVSHWNETSLERLLGSDALFRNPETAVDAYADAWALNYYLIKYESGAYADYLKTLSKKRPLMPEDPATRLKEFRQHFGDLRELERDFLRQMSRVR